MKYRIRIKPDGSMEFLGAPPPGFPVHDAVQFRFSEIVPTSVVLRRFFYWLRRVFGENGRVGNWTRTWRVHWCCVILKGPQRGAVRSSYNRNELLEWEEQVWMTGEE